MSITAAELPIMREQLEAAIWRAMYDYEIYPEKPNGFVSRIASIAARYAAGDDPLVQADRREILHRDTP